MTVAASRIDVPPRRTADAARRRRSGIVAVAAVITLSVHVLGWFALQWMPTAAGPAAKKIDESDRLALSVRLIPVTPEHARATKADGRTAPDARVPGTRESARRSGAAATPRIATRSLSEMPRASDTQRTARAARTPDQRESRSERASMPELDWGSDLATIGARRAARDAAQSSGRGDRRVGRIVRTPGVTPQFGRRKAGRRNVGGASRRLPKRIFGRRLACAADARAGCGSRYGLQVVKRAARTVVRVRGLRGGLVARSAVGRTGCRLP
ncbi:hypothetical protein [Burkholderia pyrrocinia]|uniref:hypothetical protein n=1 Tax=Burkholderia pyrrocinia TaxID=60550 RepID=UPI00201B812F|nr:hypothetical protein [Burkholderia pyrrocinia]